MRRFVRSFNFAWNGFRTVLREERNFRIQAILSAVAIVGAFVLDFTALEKALVIMAAALVVGGEIVNTAIEDLCNKIQPNHDPDIAKIKDTMAAYVLVHSAIALIVVLLVFMYKMI